jgi:hypothetical protein
MPSRKNDRFVPYKCISNANSHDVFDNSTNFIDSYRSHLSCFGSWNTFTELYKHIIFRSYNRGARNEKIPVLRCKLNI